MNFDFLTDYRVLFLVIIPIATNAYFLFTARVKRGYYRTDFTDFNWLEAVLSISLFLLITMGGWNIGRDQRIGNFSEQLGGYITSVYTQDGSHEVSEEHCSGSGADEVCYTTYSTVYHREFYVKNNIGDWWRGSTWKDVVDKPCEFCEPYSVPDFYSTAHVGKPVSYDNSYPNYLSAMNEKWFDTTYKGFLTYLPDICPETPDFRVGHHSVAKAIPVGFSETSVTRNNVFSWNFYTDVPTYDPNNISYGALPLYMDTMFGYLGGEVQADTHIYVVNSTITSYADMCLAKWKNGAKNSVFVFVFGEEIDGEFSVSDVYVGVGVDGADRNSGLEVTNESERSNYYVKYDIRKDLMEHFNKGGTLNRESVISIVSDNVLNKFTRQEMSKFEGLKKYVFPTSGWMTGMFILLLICDIAMHLWLSNNKI